jgi:hypothetical protein
LPAAGLTQLTLAGNHLDALPPGLAAASGLRVLDLACNYHFQLGEEDARELLLWLPQLTWLSVAQTRASAEALAVLRSASPQLEIVA